jgi:uncharacterized protein (DUF1501 family)
MIAQLVSVREAAGLRRQIFFCAAQGFDTHDGQVGADALQGAHADLLSRARRRAGGLRRAMTSSPWRTR